MRDWYITGTFVPAEAGLMVLYLASARRREATGSFCPWTTERNQTGLYSDPDAAARDAIQHGAVLGFVELYEV